MMMMMMMKMTQMKLVNSGTKFRPRIDKFSQPNSGGPQFQKRARGYIYIYINDIRLKDPSGTSDLGFQVWTAVRLRIPGRTNPRSKIQYVQKTFLGSRPQSRNLGSKWDCWTQGFPTQVFQNLGSWIRIQDFCPGSKIFFFENRGSWILDPYNVRLEIFKSELFSDLRFKSQKLQ